MDVVEYGEAVAIGARYREMTRARRNMLLVTASIFNTLVCCRFVDMGAIGLAGQCQTVERLLCRHGVSRTGCFVVTNCWTQLHSRCDHKLSKVVITTVEDTTIRANAFVRVFVVQTVCWPLQNSVPPHWDDTIKTELVLVACDQCPTRFEWAITKLEFVTTPSVVTNSRFVSATLHSCGHWSQPLALVWFLKVTSVWTALCFQSVSIATPPILLVRSESGKRKQVTYCARRSYL